MGASLAALILSGHRCLSDRMEAGQQSLSNRLDRIEDTVQALSDRVARLEGAFQFLVTQLTGSTEFPQPVSPNPEAGGADESVRS